jgi:hypothetical protein
MSAKSLKKGVSLYLLGKIGIGQFLQINLENIFYGKKQLLRILKGTQAWKI